MGKEVQQNLQQQQRHGASTWVFCESCSSGLSRVFKDFSFRCFFIVILSLFLLVSGIFWILPFYKVNLKGFDAKDEIKRSATLQASFRLQKPFSELIPYSDKLEYDIYEELGVPGTKVALLSMHQSGASNYTDVVFGVLSVPINIPINPVPLSVLRSSLIELFLRQSNLTLTTSIFGRPSEFEILKFSGGITVIPLQYASIWQIPQIFFNFTLNNSISDILDNIIELKDELKFGLHLRPYENVFVQITNTVGSTISPPVTVQASVTSDLGSLLPQRLKQLAQTITDSPAKNLGLDNSVFGKVKSVILSSYLKGTLHATPPTPSPAPSPELSDYAEPPTSQYPVFSPSVSPAPSPVDFGNTHKASPKGGPHQSFSPVNSPAPSILTAHPPDPCPYSHSKNPPTPRSSPPSSNPTPYFSPVGSQSQLAPDLSPIPQVSYGSNPAVEGSTSQSLGPSPVVPSSSSLAEGLFYGQIWLFGFSGLLFFCLLSWPN